MTLGALTTRVTLGAGVAGVAEHIAGVVEGDVGPGVGVVTVFAVAGPVVGGGNMTLAATGVAGVVEGHRFPGDGIVTIAAGAAVVVIGRSMAQAAIGAAGVVKQGAVPVVEGVTGVAVIAVMVGWLIIGVAIQADELPQVVEDEIIPGGRDVAGGAGARVVAGGDGMAGGAIAGFGVVVAGIPGTDAMAGGTTARVVLGGGVMAQGAFLSVAMEEDFWLPGAAGVTLAAIAGIVFIGAVVAGGAGVVSVVPVSDECPGFHAVAGGALPANLLERMVLGQVLSVAAQAVLEGGVVIDGVLPQADIQMAIGADAGIVGLGRLVGVAGFAFVDVLVGVINHFPIVGAGVA